MADIDNLESLSNAELHAQMVARGLPNIPVTDSSRKVLVKRLRVSLGGNAASPSAASTKNPGNRRETIQPSAATAAEVDKLDGPAKSRRSIAFPASDTKEADRRRKPETVAVPPREPDVVKSVAAATAAASKAVPIQERRTATQHHEQPANERVVKKPDVIIQETSATKLRKGEKTLAANTLIILESDEEEEAQMTRALNRAEEQLSVKPKTALPKLAATTTSTHQYISESAYPQQEPIIRERKQQQPQPLQRPQQQSQPLQRPQQQQQPQYASNPLYPVLEPTLQRTQQQPRQPLERPSLAYEQQPARTTAASSYATSGRYSSYLNSPNQGYAYTAGTSKAASGGLSHRRSPPRTYTTEFSDDTADDTEAPQSKFESEFARNLARLRNERIGDRSSIRASSRRSIRSDDDSTAAAFKRWCQSLIWKYNVMTMLYILFVALLIYITYRFYYY